MLTGRVVNSLVVRQLVRQLVRQPGMAGYRHGTYVVVWVLNGASLTSYVSRHVLMPASGSSSQTMRSGIGSGGFNGGVDAGAVASGEADSGTGAMVAGAGAGAVASVEVSTDGDWMYTQSGTLEPDDEFDIPNPTVEAGEIRGSRDQCHVTSRECMTSPSPRP